MVNWILLGILALIFLAWTANPQGVEDALNTIRTSTETAISNPEQIPTNTISETTKSNPLLTALLVITILGATYYIMK